MNRLIKEAEDYKEIVSIEGFFVFRPDRHLTYTSNDLRKLADHVDSKNEERMDKIAKCFEKEST